MNLSKTARFFKTTRMLALTASLASLSLASVAADTEQRDVNQQQRIEKGLESGALNTKEASRLERHEKRVNNLEAAAGRDGTVTDAEAKRIDKAQDAASAAIYKQKHDAQTGNPDSLSSRRMQENVQRNINQEQRIQQGVESGSLSTQEAARLNRAEAKTQRAEARAGADGRVNAAEQSRVQARENAASRKIHRKKNN